MDVDENRDGNFVKGIRVEKNNAIITYIKNNIYGPFSVFLACSFALIASKNNAEVFLFLPLLMYTPKVSFCYLTFVPGTTIQYFSNEKCVIIFNVFLSSLTHFLINLLSLNSRQNHHNGSLS